MNKIVFYGYSVNPIVESTEEVPHKHLGRHNNTFPVWKDHCLVIQYYVQATGSKNSIIGHNFPWAFT